MLSPSHAHFPATGTAQRLRGFPAERLATCRVPGLSARLVDGVVQLIARNSNPNGTKAQYQTAADAWSVKRDVERDLGVSLGPDFPSPEDIVTRLREAPVVEHRLATGEPFKSRTHVFDHSYEGWVLIVSVGSAKKVDEQGLQPWVETLRESVLVHEPVLLAATRLDRVLRYKWALGRVLEPLEQRAAYVYDECGLTEVNEGTAVVFFVRASHAEAEARKTQRNSIDGYRRHTEPVMVDGVVAVAAPHPPPPGFTRCWLPGRGLAGRYAAVWMLDMPELLESHGLSSSGVDQVANVKWALSQLRRGCSPKKINEELAARGYTTTALRTRYGNDATWQSVADSRWWGIGNGPIVSIRNNLDLYRTGELALTLGAGQEPIELSGLFPREGWWASPRQWVSIVDWQSRRQSRDCWRTNQFAGLSVMVNGVPAVLRSVPSQVNGQRLRAYRCQGSTGSHNVAEGVLVPHTVFADAVIDAIANAGDNAAQLTDPGVDAVADAELTAALNRAAEQANVAETRADFLVQTLLKAAQALGEKGALNSSVVAALEEDHRGLTIEADAARSEVRRLEHTLSERRRQRAHRTALDSDALLELVSAVSEPDDHPLRDVVVDALQHVEVRTDGCGRYGDEAQIEVDVSLAFNAVGSTWESRGTATYVRPSKRLALVEEKIADLRSGRVPASFAWSLDDLAHVMGVDRNAVNLLRRIDDPWLANVHVEVLVFPSRSDKDLATELGVDIEVVRRVRAVHRLRAQRDSFSWLQKNSPKCAAAYDLADEDSDSIARWANLVPSVVTKRSLVRDAMGYFGLSEEWTAVRGVGLKLTRSCECGEQRFVPVRVREVAGSLCASCGRDRTGIRWPADFTDRYSHVR